MQNTGIYTEFSQLLSILLITADFILALEVIKRAAIYAGRRVTEAMGSRSQKRSIYHRCKTALKRYANQYGAWNKEKGLLSEAAEKMKRSGYTGEKAPIVYLTIKYLLVPALFVTGLIMNYPDILPAFAVPIGIYILIEAVLASNKRKISLKLQKYLYKVYKYLHNQISSGVRIPDAIGTVYEVIDDMKLRSIMIRFAAVYELTLDIDKALEEFRMNFDTHEAETLCVVLKQGIETGDNQELLARQEDVMFKKYFNYIQAETDSCKTRSLLSAVMYTAVVVLMIIIPLVNDTTDALNNIFVN